MKGCMRCNMPYKDSEHAASHQLHHLKELDLFCGFIRFRCLTVVPARCVFCLSKGKLNEFSALGIFKSHLSGHMCSVRDFRCPHPLCTTLPRFITKKQLAIHLASGHGIVEEEEEEEMDEEGGSEGDRGSKGRKRKLYPSKRREKEIQTLRKLGRYEDAIETPNKKAR